MWKISSNFANQLLWHIGMLVLRCRSLVQNGFTWNEINSFGVSYASMKKNQVYLHLLITEVLYGKKHPTKVSAPSSHKLRMTWQTKLNYIWFIRASYLLHKLFVSFCTFLIFWKVARASFFSLFQRRSRNLSPKDKEKKSYVNIQRLQK